jgi:hypothetical protein
MDVFDLADSIEKKEDFINFIDAFIDDFQKNKSEWENTDIESFFSAMQRYCSDKKINEVSWKVFADILLGASIYE